MSLSAARPRAPDLSGCALDERYELHALLGEGTFGRVYAGRDRRLGRAVAVKVIKPWWAEDPEWVRRFEREARLMASVSDRQIVQVFDVGLADEGPYYVAELVDGESLETRLAGGPLSPSFAAELTEQLSWALGAAHDRGVLHGDVKPANVLVSRRGGVKITDFGLARLLEGTGRLSTTLAGTPTYMAPEQATSRPPTAAADVYSVGVILYELLAGHPPFRGGSPVELALRHLQEPPPPLPSGIPSRLAAVTMRALAKDPDDRYGNGAELARALSEATDPDHPAETLLLEPVAPAPEPATATARAAVPSPGSAPDGATPSGRGTNATRVAPRWTPRRTVDPTGRRRTIGVFAVVLLRLAGMLAAAILTSARQTRVPDLRGLTRSQLSPRIARSHLRLVLHSRYSSAPRNTVIGERPAPGAHAAYGSRVIAVLSAGPPPVPVPRLIGFSSGDAQSAVDQLGLDARVVPVPAFGAGVGTVARQFPSPATRLQPGRTVALFVAQAPRWRNLLRFDSRAGNTSPAFRIQGRRWRIVYRMAYQGTCSLIFFCSGPTARVMNASTGASLSTFDLGEGTDQVSTVAAGPGLFQVRITPGQDSASWSAEVQDYY